MLLCTKTSVLRSPHKGICKSCFLNLHPVFECIIPVASPALKTLTAETSKATESKQ